MKTIKKFLVILLITFFIGGTMSSCLVFETRHDHGHHKGWYKNPHNPHHPNHHKHKGGK